MQLPITHHASRPQHHQCSGRHRPSPRPTQLPWPLHTHLYATLMHLMQRNAFKQVRVIPLVFIDRSLLVFLGTSRHHIVRSGVVLSSLNWVGTPSLRLLIIIQRAPPLQIQSQRRHLHHRNLSVRRHTLFLWHSLVGLSFLSVWFWLLSVRVVCMLFFSLYLSYIRISRFTPFVSLSGKRAIE